MSDKVSVDQQNELNRIISTYKQYRADISELANKIAELENDRHEHILVINAIKDLDPSRRCYRSIGGILVERTVGDTLPTIQKNVQQIETVLQQLSIKIKDKEKQAEEWRVKHNITETTGQEQQQSYTAQRQPRENEGVLV